VFGHAEQCWDIHPLGCLRCQELVGDCIDHVPDPGRRAR
jgi:hypothetical protein